MLAFFIFTFSMLQLVASPAQDLFTMRINISKDALKKIGISDWNQGKVDVSEMLQRADIIGIQKAQIHQIEDLGKLLKKYKWVGTSDPKNKENGEISAIFFKSEKFNLDAWDTFPLPNKPKDEEPSQICTWARLLSQNQAGIYVFTTDLSPLAEPKRLESSNFLIKKFNERKYIDEPILVLGDFLLPPKSSPPVQPIQPEYAKLTRYSLPNKTFAYATNNSEVTYTFHTPPLTVLKSTFLNPSKRNIAESPSNHWPQLSHFSWNQVQQRKLIDWLYFKETALKKEFGDGNNVIVRWTLSEIPMRLIGANQKQSKLTEKALNEINQALAPAGISIKLSTKPSQNEIRCYWGSYESLKEVCKKENLEPPPNYAGFSSVNWITKTKSIINAQVLIAYDRIDQRNLYHVLLEEITQSLGLLGDNSVFPESVTFSRGNDQGNASTLSHTDKKSLVFFYSQLLPGDTEQKVKQKFLELWK
jgi:endonuclease/exonuclease/phosphatase family metal-dependent hydrolase